MFEAVHFFEVDNFFEVGHFNEVVHLLTHIDSNTVTQTLSHFINNFYWSNSVFQGVDLVGVDHVGVDLVGS